MSLRRHHQDLEAPAVDRAAFTGDDAPRLRRVHKKSRAGCHECKRRHLKCDETRPACSRCVKAKRACHFPASARNSTPPPAAAAHTEAEELPQSQDVADDASSANAIPSPSATETANQFTLLSVDDNGELPICSWPLTREQMGLLQHAEARGLPYGAADDLSKRVAKEVIETAWAAPYLMDLMLSLASLHLAELSPSQNAVYRQQAMQLQTRGLAVFNEAKEDPNPETCLPMFLFSSLIGSTVLYETLRHRDDFSDFLDAFVSYLHLHRGVRAVIAGTWYDLRRAQTKGIYEHFPNDEEMKKLMKEGTECDPLDEMLEQSDLGPAAVDACRSTIDHLRSSYAIYHHLSRRTEHTSSSAVAFAVRVTPMFVDLIEQRQPESLVVLAYYAVLLHWCRGFWLFDDGGDFIVRGITSHLGKYWHQWLIYPNDEIGNYT